MAAHCKAYDLMWHMGCLCLSINVMSALDSPDVHGCGTIYHFICVILNYHFSSFARY